MFVAHAAPATPIGRTASVRPNTSTGGVPKMRIGSSSRFEPKPTTMQSIDLTASPSDRIAADSPNAMCEKTCDSTTMRR